MNQTRSYLRPPTRHDNGLGPMTWRSVRRISVPMTAILAGILVAACGSGDLGESPAERCVPEGACDSTMFEGGISAVLGKAEAGVGLYVKECARCHGPDGRGIAEAKQIDMTSPAWQASLRDATIVKIVRSGRAPLMPAFDFSDDELRNLLAHLRTFDSGRAAPSPPPPSRGGY
jgi:mono/diheme cytochrome c family protein